LKKDDLLKDKDSNAKNNFGGKGDDYNRQDEYNVSFQASSDVEEEPSEESDGRSASTEGDIANHNPFNNIQTAFIINKNKQDEEKKRADDEMPSVVTIVKKTPAKSPQKPPRSQPKKQEPVQDDNDGDLLNRKTILYSDKSESSIDEMMGDTPSNYNLLNGRLEGKSHGLKGLNLTNNASNN